MNMQKLAAHAAGWMPDVLMTAGAAGVTVGAWMVYRPAGWIAGGLFLLAAGWLLARGAE